jgi:hypothetical protein
MNQKGTDGLLVSLSPLIPQYRKSFSDLHVGSLSGSLVFVCLLRILDQNKTTAPFSLSNDHFLDLKIFFDLLISPWMRENFLVVLPSVSKFLAKNIMFSRSLKDNTILLTIHHTVHHPDTSRELPTRQVLLHPFDRGYVLHVARKYPATHRQTFLGHGQSNDHLRQIRPFAFRMHILPESFLIFLIPFHIGRRGIEEKKVHFQIQEIRGSKEDLLLDHLFLLQKEIHGPI